MRSRRYLIASLLMLPSVAWAQVFAPPPPPHVYIQNRIRWHLLRHLPFMSAPPPPPVWIAAAPPPPPVYVAPPPPVVIQPQPYYVQPTYQSPPPPPPAPPVQVVIAAPVPKPQWTSRFGLGATAEGLFEKGASGSQGFGVLGQLRYRTSRHTALELMAGYERSNIQGVQRSDVPITFGLLVPFLGPEHMFSPYFVVAGGVNFADLRLVDSPDFKLDDRRVQGLGQLGGGVELRLGQHFAINADARIEGRWNLGGASADVSATTVKVDGAVINPLSASVGLRLGVGGTVYF